MEIRAYGREEARLDVIQARMKHIARLAGDRRYFAPTHAEALELLSRLVDARLLQVRWQRGERLPLVSLTVHEIVVAEALAHHAIARRFLPVDSCAD